MATRGLFRPYMSLILMCVIISRVLSGDVYPCLNSSTIVYDAYGNVNVQESLAVCLAAVNSPDFNPAYITGKAVNVTNEFLLNNLISIDNLSNQVNFDFYYRLYWTDPRLSAPALFEALGSVVSANGLNIIQYLGDSIWLPDNFFTEAVAVSTTDSYLKLYPDGNILWSRHFTLSLLQSQLNFKTYPDDSQQLVLRTISYSSSQSFIMQQIHQPCVSLYPSYDGSESFAQNPLWTYESSTCKVSVTGLTGSLRSEALVFINLKRISGGIVARLALPIFLLCLLGKRIPIVLIPTT